MKHHDHDMAQGGHHLHGSVDPTLVTTEKGIYAIKWSMLGLGLTAVFQAFLVVITSSAALLADTIHNLGDAATAVPLWIAFLLARKKPSSRFSYGYGRVEDVAGIVILFIMLLSAALAGRVALVGLVQPADIQYPIVIAVGSCIGFLGNEWVARFRIRIGQQIQSAALIADGYHARADGLTSLGVVLGALGVWLGYPRADPLIGLVITVVIFKICWDVSKSLFTRLLDGVDPDVIPEVRHAASHVPEVLDITEVRVRWMGHRMWAEVNIAVDSERSVQEGHAIAGEVRHRLLHHLPYLANATIHVDPANASGERHHALEEHRHDDLPSHSH